MSHETRGRGRGTPLARPGARRPPGLTDGVTVHTGLQKSYRVPAVTVLGGRLSAPRSPAPNGTVGHYRIRRIRPGETVS